MRRYLFVLLLVLFGFTSGWANTFKLTASEQSWLDAHPEITIGLIENIPPMSMVGKDGVPEGIDAELIKLLNKKLSGRLKIVIGPWQKIYNDVKDKRLDALFNFTPSEERRAYFNFTRPYIAAKHAIVAKTKGQHFGSLASLSGHTVAQVENSFIVSYLQEQYPTIKIKTHINAIECLKAVQRGEAQAVIGNELVLNYLLKTKGLNDLDVHGHSAKTSDTNVIAVRKDWPEFTSLLDRALASIPLEELSAATNYWDKADTLGIAAKGIELTDEEMIWIQTHPNITVGAETDWPPYDYVTNGKAAGFSNAYMRLLAEKAGLSIQFIHGFPWSELLEMGKRKELDVFPCISKNEERKSFLNFTTQYLVNTESLVVHQDATEIKSLEDMAGKTLVRIDGYSSNQRIRELYPEIKFIYVQNPVEALVEVSEGRADAFMDFLAVTNYLRREHLIPNLRIANPNVFPETFPLHIGVRKDWPTLNSILEKTMLAVTQKEYENLKNLWLTTEQMNSAEFQLGSAEKEWLKGLGTLRLGVSTSWVPINFKGDDATHHGIASDYMKIMGKKLGLELEVSFGSWQELQAKARNGEIDILPSANDTKERQEYLSFTKPYLKIPIIIATRIEAPFYAHIEDLNGITVGVKETSAIQEKLQYDYPEITTKGYKTTESAMIALNTGEIGAMVTNSTVFTHFQNMLDLQNKIHINNTASYENELSMGVRHELTPLIPLLNRALADISASEHELIMDKWTNLPVHKETDWSMVWRVAGVGVVVILLVLFWVWRMLREIKRRREAENNLQQILLNSPVEIVVVDENNDIISCNKKFTENFGYVQSDIATAEKWWDAAYPDLEYREKVQTEWLAAVEEAKATGEPFAPQTWTLTCKDGEERTAIFSVVSFDKFGVITIVDITERKQAEKEKLNLERQVLHAQKLESLGVLAGGIAHDFNNILAAVLGYAELSLLALPRENPAYEYIENIIDASIHASELSNQMLAYSGKGHFVIEPINVNLMVTEMTQMLKTSISKSADLKFNLAENIHTIDADVTQIRQVFMNLITNASEAIDDNNGTIAVSTGNTHVNKDDLNKDIEEGDYTFIEVNDTGCGMHEETQKKMFDPFFTTKFTGRGLGMAATMGIIRGHKGAIYTHSKPGKGTTIKVLFPSTGKFPEDPRSEKKHPPLLDRKQSEGVILVVDDEKALRDFVQIALTQVGYTVLTAVDGIEGLEIFSKKADEITLVLLDIMMPRMGGEEAFSEMRKIRPDVQVLLTSGYDKEEAANRFADMGLLAGFIKKPFRPTALVNKIQELLDHQISTGDDVV